MNELKLLRKILASLQNIYYSIKEYSLESAINKVQNDIGKLNIKILNGDKSAGRLAFEYLEEKDRLERMKEK